MGYFYIDESIHDRAGFILGAYVYAREDLSPPVIKAIETVGLVPGIDEFKSGSVMSADPARRALRERMREILSHVRIGLLVIPRKERASFGDEALIGLKKIALANGLSAKKHTVYFDEGISLSDPQGKSDALGLAPNFVFHFYQDSRLVGGLQVADLAAHTMSIMLLESLGIQLKKVKAGPDSGYDPDLDIELGFEMWAYVRYQLFSEGSAEYHEDDPIASATVATASSALHIAESCPEALRLAALSRFGSMYLGCIH